MLDTDWLSGFDHVLRECSTLHPIGHERSLTNRLRTWSHPRRIPFLCADCIFEFQFFSSRLEITLLFCLRYFRCCTNAFQLQCFAESASPGSLPQLMRKQP